ncbi:hypothetical protein FCG40_11095 [Fimbriimonadia bacterium ATM]|nr:MAG: hypothetical protein EDM73_00415 [Armatimonadota bacterium]MBC6969620.1 hypothetical protein [Armatimonadota bacterium]MCE7898889.1 hypothetical protein [Armatimonadetes bacterium ATM1]MDL1929521.1 hypothetical protein [Fimbriimonadia bacterium ATM]RIJ97872.1 MAG: hypothetical protein DCC45_02085 [Armatimonadota bacterium]
MPKYLGIDCGGTRTRAVLVEPDRAVWRGEGGPINLAWSSPDQVANTLKEILSDCPAPDSVCGAFAGLLGPDSANLAESVLRDVTGASSCVAVADFVAAFEASEGIDICVIAGTGSLICSRSARGDIVSSGGRGYVLGDEGSAFQYGREALLHFLDAPPDDVSAELRRAVEEIFGTLKKNEVISRLYGEANLVTRLSKLACAFDRDAGSGAIYALKALRIHPAKLAHRVSMHIRDHHQQTTRLTIGCRGGVWNSASIRRAFIELLAFWCPSHALETVFELPEAVLGAVSIAKRALR